MNCRYERWLNIKKKNHRILGFRVKCKESFKRSEFRGPQRSKHPYPERGRYVVSR